MVLLPLLLLLLLHQLVELPQPRVSFSLVVLGKIVIIFYYAAEEKKKEEKKEESEEEDDDMGFGLFD